MPEYTYKIEFRQVCLLKFKIGKYIHKKKAFFFSVIKVPNLPRFNLIYILLNNIRKKR